MSHNDTTYQEPTVIQVDNPNNLSHVIITMLAFAGVYTLGKAVGTLKERRRQANDTLNEVK